MSANSKGVNTTQSLKERMSNIKDEIGESMDNINNKKPVSKAKSSSKLVSVTGRLDKKNHGYSASTIYILDNLMNDVKSVCAGNTQAILNHLISLGLDAVKESDSVSIIDIADLEDRYS